LNRKEILERSGSPGDRLLMARVLDKIETVKKTHDIQVSDFLDPSQQALISPVLSQVPGISFLWAGGYLLSERRRLVITPDYLEPDSSDARLEVLAMTGSPKFHNLCHRDYLGAILSLGVKREKIGDLIVAGDGCQVIVDRDIAEYISTNLLKVGRAGIRVEKVSLEDLRLPEEQVREIFATVPSLRLDAVAAAGFGVSRTKIAAEIAAEKARVNWHVVTDSSYPVGEGDRISIRGRGRMEIDRVKGETKKGRLSLVLRRFY